MTRVMTIWMGFAAVLGASLLAGAHPARAIEYPWCFTSVQDGVENCGYTSQAQCQETMRGKVGICTQNLRYPEAPAKQKARPAR